ncbi:MAG: hypothetical protein BWY52_02935 [Chloroflexi bacterium ADurb.Bin325]|nr:MAG: hypothetical protein BWY52_02935 [Chloroflexi bacterium ADurb.Bin325]
MTWHASLSRLVQILANLYGTEAEARLVAKDAGLDLTRISFSGSAQVIWDAIVAEAHKQNKAPALIERARVDFPTETGLPAILQDYLAWRREATVAEAPSAPRSYQLTAQQKRQLVDALLGCPTMQGGQSRDAVLDDLRAEIRNTARRHSSARVDVNNIVSAALAYAGGLQELVEAVRNYEGDSLPMAEVDRTVASFG